MSQGVVCVTGATGFVGHHTVRELLNRGYHVHGTTRCPPSDPRNKHLKSLPFARERLKLFRADLTGDDAVPAFRRAFRGCEGVIHCASPFNLNSKRPYEELLVPAVEGTRAVMEAAGLEGVKRVVMTSSMAAITDEPEPGVVYDETVWNERSSLSRNPYYFSKAEAERAAWEFVETRSPRFDLVTVLPTAVMGPEPGPTINTSNAVLSRILNGELPAVIDMSWPIVDVRDVASAHVLCLETPSARGRYLVGKETVPMSEVCQVIHDMFPRLRDRLPRRDWTTGCMSSAPRTFARCTMPRGDAQFVRSNLHKPFVFSAAKVGKELGLDYLPLEVTITDALNDLLEKGAIKGFTGGAEVSAEPRAHRSLSEGHRGGLQGKTRAFTDEELGGGTPRTPRRSPAKSTSSVSSSSSSSSSSASASSASSASSLLSTTSSSTASQSTASSSSSRSRSRSRSESTSASSSQSISSSQSDVSQYEY
jgi:dihydroflavonol-4-reductase